MVQRLIAVCLAGIVCFTANLLHAQSSAFLRETFLTCEVVKPLSINEAAAWAHLFLEVGDADAANAVGASVQIGHFMQKSIARHTIDQLIAAFPRSDYLYNNLAWTLYLAETDATRAYQLVRQIKRHDDASRDSYAMIALRMGYPAEALQQILKSLEVRYDRLAEAADPIEAIKGIQRLMVTFDHAGDIFYRNGHNEIALQAWQRSYHYATRLQQEEGDTYFLIGAYDIERVKKKARALRKKLQTLNDATTL
jgi:hypothetical protein